MQAISLFRLSEDNKAEYDTGLLLTLSEWQFFEFIIMTFLGDAPDSGASESHETIHIRKKCANHHPTT